jgi:ribonuclease HI
VDIHVIFPQKTQTIKNVVLPRTATKDEIANLIQRQLRTDPLNSDFIEFAPENWFETRELYAKFRYVRQDITALGLTTPEAFRQTMHLTIPFFIETDGACSGNPGPGGWGFIISQGVNKIEVYGAEGHTSNNEMELRAIDEALKFFGNVRGYAVLESDSQGCLDMMLGRGLKWEADNFIRLNGTRVKNQELVSSITARLRSFNVEFRKVKGHSDDPWNDKADELADRGRDEAAAWPKRTFDIVTKERPISFRERATRPEMPLQELYNALKMETSERIPNIADTKLFRDGAEFSGVWTPGHYQFRHKSLPPPSGPISAPQPVAPKGKPIKC